MRSACLCTASTAGRLRSWTTGLGARAGPLALVHGPRAQPRRIGGASGRAGGTAHFIMVLQRRGMAQRATPPAEPVFKSENDVEHPAGRARAQGHDHAHAHDGHAHDHSHEGHSHGLFSSHNHEAGEGAGQILAAMQGKGHDAGSRITLIGLASNVGLTAMKAVAGVMMNSASLVAEAGHSLSDLLGDFVTLACWRISRRPPSDTYPWGYGKFETFGTLSVSIILVGGAIGIGLHSYHLLLQSLLPWLSTLDPSSPFAQVAHYLPASVPSPLLDMFHSHGPSAVDAHNHTHSHIAEQGAEHATKASGASEALLNPHAAWFALASVIIKEWLYRATKKVADHEHSPVLHANALHHRSDALTSGVALASILGSAMGATVLDPLGGLAVSFFILQQGLGLSKTAFLELLDKGITPRSRAAIEGIITPMIDGEKLLAVRNIRGVKSGGLSFVDLTISVPPEMSVRDAHEVESAVREAVMTARREVRELKVHVHGFDADEHAREMKQPENGEVRSDFGRDGC